MLPNVEFITGWSTIMFFIVATVVITSLLSFCRKFISHSRYFRDCRMLAGISRMFARFWLLDSIRAIRWYRRCKKIQREKKKEKKVTRMPRESAAFWWLAPAFQLLRLVWFMALLARFVWKGLFFPVSENSTRRKNSRLNQCSKCVCLTNSCVHWSSRK